MTLHDISNILMGLGVGGLIATLFYGRLCNKWKILCEQILESRREIFSEFLAELEKNVRLQEELKNLKNELSPTKEYVHKAMAPVDVKKWVNIPSCD